MPARFARFPLVLVTVIALGILSHPLPSFGQGVTKGSDGQEERAPSTPSPEDRLQPVTFEDVAPVLNARCVMCHTGPQAAAQLRLDAYPQVMAGAQKGPVIEPGNPEDSELLRRIKGTSLPRMPMTGPPWLSDAEIELLENWITGGALEHAPTQEAHAASPAQEPDPAGESTWSQMASLLQARCVKCHAERGMMGPPPQGIRLDSYEAVFSSPERPTVIPVHPLASTLYRSVAGLSRPAMPYDGPPYLEDSEVRLVRLWIEEGAPDAEGTPAPVPVGRELRLTGTLSGLWELDGLPLGVDSNTRLDKNPTVGRFVEVRGTMQEDGSFKAYRIRPR